MKTEDSVVLPEKWLETIQTLVSKLNKKEKKTILKLIARISESSYRRGVHHTIWLLTEDKLPKQIINDLGTSFRYHASLDRSKSLTDARKMSSVDRLLEQYSLHLTGLEETYEKEHESYNAK